MKPAVGEGKRERKVFENLTLYAGRKNRSADAVISALSLANFGDHP